jgi:hypothetical protein
LVHNKTQSKGRASAGSVEARRGTSMVPSGRSTASRSSGRLTQAMTSCRSAARRQPAMTPPMLPRPTTPMVARAGFAALLSDDMNLKDLQPLFLGPASPTVLVKIASGARFSPFARPPRIAAV